MFYAVFLFSIAAQVCFVAVAQPMRAASRSIGVDASKVASSKAPDLTAEVRALILRLLDIAQDTIATDIVVNRMDELCGKLLWCRTDSIRDCDSAFIGNADRDSLGCVAIGANHYLSLDPRKSLIRGKDSSAAAADADIMLTQYASGGDDSELFLLDRIKGKPVMTIARRVGDAGEFVEMYIYRSCKVIEGLKLCTVYRVDNVYYEDELKSSDLTVLFVYDSR